MKVEKQTVVEVYLELFWKLFEAFDYTFVVVFFLSILIGYSILALLILWILMMYFVYSNCFLRFRMKAVKGQRTALITGASSGIGFELARLFLRNEWNLVIVSRNPRNIRGAKKVLDEQFKNEKLILRIKAYSLDLSKPGSAHKLFRKLEDEGIEIDCVVSNAGFGYCGSFLDQDLENIVRMMQLNMSTLTILTKLLLPSMIKRKFGRILNISSFASAQPSPNYAVYSATKSFVRSFSLALSEELRDHKNVTSTCICPGFVDTNFNNIALGKNKDTILSQTARYQSAEECAFEGYRALMVKEVEYIPGVENWVYVKYISPFIPTFISSRILKWITKIEKESSSSKESESEEEEEEEETNEDRKSVKTD